MGRGERGEGGEGRAERMGREREDERIILKPRSPSSLEGALEVYLVTLKEGGREEIEPLAFFRSGVEAKSAADAAEKENAAHV